MGTEDRGEEERGGALRSIEREGVRVRLDEAEGGLDGALLRLDEADGALLRLDEVEEDRADEREPPRWPVPPPLDAPAPLPRLEEDLPAR